MSNELLRKNNQTNIFLVEWLALIFIVINDCLYWLPLKPRSHFKIFYTTYNLFIAPSLPITHLSFTVFTVAKQPRLLRSPPFSSHLFDLRSFSSRLDEKPFLSFPPNYGINFPWPFAGILVSSLLKALWKLTAFLLHPLNTYWIKKITALVLFFPSFLVPNREQKLWKGFGPLSMLYINCIIIII